MLRLINVANSKVLFNIKLMVMGYIFLLNLTLAEFVYFIANHNSYIRGMSPKPNRYLELMGIAAQMGITIFLGAYLGKWLDLKYPSGKKWYTILLTLLSVAIALYMVLKQVNNLNKDEDKK